MEVQLPMQMLKSTQEELGHSVIGCARTTCHDCARTNQSRGKSHGVFSSEKKLLLG